MTSTLPPGSPKGILIKPGTPRSNKRNNVNWSSDVVLIGQNKNIPLQAPASTNEELTFEYNPPANTSSSYAKPSSGRAGTMRVKGPGVMGKKGAKKSVMSLYGPPEPQKPEVKRDPAVIQGYLKLLKQTGMKSTWLKRYVALTNKSLSYYKAEDSTKALKEIEITGDCYVREISQKAGVTGCQNALELSYDRKNSIVLKGSSQREATEWITSICTVVDALAGVLDDDDEFEFVDEDDFVEIDAKPSQKKDSGPFDAPISSTSKSSTMDEEEYYFYDEDEDEFVEDSPTTAAPAPAVDTKKEESKKREEERKKKEQEEAERNRKDEAARKRREEEEERKRKEQQEAERKRKDEAARKQREEELRKKAEETLEREKKNEIRRREEKAQQERARLQREAKFKPAATGSPSVIKSSPYSAASANKTAPVNKAKFGNTGAMKSVGTPAKPATASRVGNLMKMFEKPS